MSMPQTDPQPLLTFPQSAPETLPMTAPASNPELPAARKLRRRWPGPLLWLTVFAGAAGLLWAAAAWWLPGRRVADVLTAAATRGELVITVTDRGELESSQSLQVVCEVEGGGKVAN